MRKMSARRLIAVLALVAVLLAAKRDRPGASAPSHRASETKLDRILARVAPPLDRKIGWDRLPKLLGLGTIVGLRVHLRKLNLYDTETLPSTAPPDATPMGPPPARYLVARAPDGTYNDLKQPWMGSANTRFGRNVPLDRAFPEPEPAILEPNPRTISRELMTRNAFTPVPHLNLFVAAWIQFMVRDWFSHGKSPKENPWELPLSADDPWPERPMRIMRVPPDPTRPPDSDGPPTYRNIETPWWDGSQLYGNNQEQQDKLRSGEHGKLRIGPDGLPPVDPLLPADRHPANIPGFWVGLAMLQSLFIREHNAICDRLRAEYTSWSDDELFDHARLINAALLAKIHTVEWTPAIISHPTTQFALRANWWGLKGERLTRLIGRIPRDEVLSGIIGFETHHFDVPYSLTEEFTAVYRMHPLIPDDFAFHSAANDALIEERTFPQVAGRNGVDVWHRISTTDLHYSFGIANPGMVELHNFPRSLQHFERPDGRVQDLAAIDILRMRELGVPRYNEFRKLIHKPPVKTFEELTGNHPVWTEEIRRVYNGDIDRVDLMVGMFAEPKPKGFGFSDTAFRIFILMASRRLNSDRFFTVDYTPQVYTQVGLDWIEYNSMITVLLRHFPALAPSLRNVKNAFYVWDRTGA